mgnify:CR=1 FL=1
MKRPRTTANEPPHPISAFSPRPSPAVCALRAPYSEIADRDSIRTFEKYSTRMIPRGAGGELNCRHRDFQSLRHRDLIRPRCSATSRVPSLALGDFVALDAACAPCWSGNCDGRATKTTDAEFSDYLELGKGRRFPVTLVGVVARSWRPALPVDCVPSLCLAGELFSS